MFGKGVCKLRGWGKVSEEGGAWKYLKGKQVLLFLAKNGRLRGENKRFLLTVKPFVLVPFISIFN